MINSYPLRIGRYLVERMQLPLLSLLLVVQYWFIVRQTATNTDPWLIAVGFGTLVGTLIVLRILDEFKDYAHDQRYYPERPLQRGLVRKADLLGLLSGTIVALAVANAWFAPAPALVALVVTTGYIILMAVEFFVGTWLRPRLLAYLVTHELFAIPLFSYIILLHEGRPELWFILTNLAAFVVIEVARKIRPTTARRSGSDTYSAYLGPTGASLLLVAAQLGFLFCLRQAGVQSGWLWALILLPLVALSWYRRTDSRGSSRLVLGASILFVVSVMAGSQ